MHPRRSAAVGARRSGLSVALAADNTWLGNRWNVPERYMAVDMSGVEKFVAQLYSLDPELRERMRRRSSPLDDLAYLSMLLRANEVVDVVEVGTYLGMSSLIMASSIRGKYHTINNNARETTIAKELAATFGINNVVFHAGDSKAVLPKLVEKVAPRLGAVYIDGFHSYTNVMEEYRIAANCFAKSESAAVIFDDVHKLHPDGAHDGGVPKAVAEIGAIPVPFLGFRKAIKPYGKFRIL